MRELKPTAENISLIPKGSDNLEKPLKIHVKYICASKLSLGKGKKKVHGESNTLQHGVIAK